MAADGAELACLHFLDHLGGEGFSASVDVVFVEIDGEGILEFF